MQAGAGGEGASGETLQAFGVAPTTELGSCNSIRNHEGVPQPRNPFFRTIDHPVVQAHADSPTWYLSHDVYGNWNIYGCPYLDADCEEKGFGSQVAYVFAHHMDDGSMFAPLARLNPHECNEILLQAPDEKMRLEICAVDIVNAWSELKQIDFPSDAAFREWIRDVRGAPIPSSRLQRMRIASSYSLHAVTTTGATNALLCMFFRTYISTLRYQPEKRPTLCFAPN